jgi:hypothetical protein
MAKPSKLALVDWGCVSAALIFWLVAFDLRSHRKGHRDDFALDALDGRFSSCKEKTDYLMLEAL